MNKLLIALVTCMTAFSAINTKAAESLFNTGEVGLTLSSGYLINPESVRSVRTVPQSQVEYEGCHPRQKTVIRNHDGERTVNITAGAFWYPTKLLGVEANVPFYSTEGVSVQEVQTGLLLRLPLFNGCPVLRHVAPYGGIGTVYNWKEGDRWSYVGKGGVNIRLNKKWGIFGEYQYRNVNFNLDQGHSTVQGGFNFVF